MHATAHSRQQVSPLRHWRDLVRLSAPLIIALLANAAMTFIDTMLMGMLGVDALAGGGLGAAIYNFVFLVCIGVLVAVSTSVAFARGKRDDNAMHAFLLAGMVLALLLSLVCGAVLWYGPRMLGWLDLPAASLASSQVYLQSVVWALLPALAFNVLRNFSMAVGKAGAILRISVVAAICNYPVSYALMTGWGGLPVLGLAGIGYGTALMALFMFVAFCADIYRKAMFKPFKFWRRWHLFQWHAVLHLWRLGLPIGLALAMEVGLFSVSALLAGLLGAVELAAHQIALQCVTLSFMFPLGISQALSIMVGERMGREDYRAIWWLCKQGLLTGLLCSSVAVLVFWLMPATLVDVFLANAEGARVEDVYRVSLGLLLVAAFFQLVDGMQVILMGALRGLQFSMGPTLVALIGYWGVGFPAAFWWMDRWSVQGVWAGMGVGLAVTALLLLVILYGFLRRQLKRAASEVSIR